MACGGGGGRSKPAERLRPASRPWMAHMHLVLMAVLALFGAANCLAPPLQDATRAQKQQGTADHDQVAGAAGFSPALAFSQIALQQRPQRARSSPGLARMLTRLPRRGGAASFCAASMSAGAELVSVEAAKRASFEQAQKLGLSLGAGMSERLKRGGAAAEVEEQALRALLSHSDGARGFYVTTLTAPELQNMFATPLDSALVEAIKASPDPNAQLLTMNIAMSTATELAHLANGNAEYAKGSAMTRERTRTLIATLIPALPPLKEHLTDLLAATTMPATAPAVQSAGVESYRAFLKRWGYNDRMREAIATTVRPFTL